MQSDIQDQMHEIEELRLPELQARFAEIVGEPTRTPNKQYLLRRIAGALEAKQADGGAVSDDADEDTVNGNVTAELPTDDDGDADIQLTATTDVADIKLTKLTIPDLQERYRQTIGRDTRSTWAAYLQWKIRQAEKGRVRIGLRVTRRAGRHGRHGRPVQRRTTEGEFKVLPLRMAAETVTALDEARVRLVLPGKPQPTESGAAEVSATGADEKRAGPRARSSIILRFLYENWA